MPGPRAEHHLEAALEGEDLGVEARAGDDVGQEVLDVVEGAGLRHRVREVEDLLLEQELLFVVEHGADGSSGPIAGDRRRRIEARGHLAASPDANAPVSRPGHSWRCEGSAYGYRPRIAVASATRWTASR